MQATVISMSVFAAFFLILGIVAITIYKVKDPKRGGDSDIEDALAISPQEDELD